MPGKNIQAVTRDISYEGPYFDSLNALQADDDTRQVIFIIRLSTPLGPMFGGTVEEGICLLEFNDRRSLSSELKELMRLLNGKIRYGDHLHFDLLEQQLNEYFKGIRQRFELPLTTPGTGFQKKVWEKLLEIPYGKTRSYNSLAIELGNPGSLRAVGKANGSNRISIIIPCHRVIGEDGSLTGYGGGLHRKKWLLDFEAAHSGQPRQTAIPFEEFTNLEVQSEK
jgi:AraC family transcriptional regulator of adaptative response/methylated-DNA-[protein]-cysteine methyltransferase